MFPDLADTLLIFFSPRISSCSVYCLEFDTRRIITGSRDRTIKVWSLKTGRLLVTFFGAHRGSVLCLKFSQDWDRDWDIIDEEFEVQSLPEFESRERPLHMESSLLSAHSSSAGPSHAGPSSDAPYSLAGNLSTDDSKGMRKFKPGFMVSGSSDCSVCVWDLSLGDSLGGGDDDDERRVYAQVRAILKGHTGGVLDLKIDEKWIVSW